MRPDGEEIRRTGQYVGPDGTTYTDIFIGNLIDPLNEAHQQWSVRGVELPFSFEVAA